MADATSNPPAADNTHLSRAEEWISITLRAGVLVSLALIVFGTLVTFTHHPQYLASEADLTRLTTPGAAFPHTLADLAAGLVAFRGQAIVVAGLIVLIATPVLRVGISVLVFLADRDYAFVLITTTVFVILIASFLLGRAE
jgi:uncharacterized membrane protein